MDLRSAKDFITADHLPADIPDLPLSVALRQATKPQHTEAEKTGIIQDILKGRADRRTYALFLRNLLPAYRALETGLQRHARSPGVRHIVMPALLRTAALEADLVALSGPAWGNELHLLPAGAAYGHRIEAAAAGDGAGLIAHAYTRYLGDLSGGQIIKRILARTMQLPPQALNFYDFPNITDQAAFKAAYRQSLDRAGIEVADITVVLEEGRVAFQCNIDLSNSVQRIG